MKDLFLLDGHCDTAIELYRQGKHLRENDLHCDLQQATFLQGWAQFFAFCIAGYSWPAHMTDEQVFLAAYQYFMRELVANKLPVCTDPAQLKQSLSEHRVSAMLALEGAEGIGCDPGKLDLLGQMGFSMVSTVWNLENALAGSHLTGQRLSAQGREFIRRAQKLGFIVDVSHCSDAAFKDICELAELPIVASHSNSRAVCPHSRNLTDDMYKAICGLGGVAGLNLYVPFLAERHADLETVWRHLDHFLQLAGSDCHVGLGLDLDGCDQLAEGFTGLGSYPRLAEFLMARGLSEQTLRRVFHENFMGVFDLCTRKRTS